MPKSIIVFCDFDGTITTKDSFAEFIKFYKSPTLFYFGLILCSPFLLLFKLRVLSNQAAKELLTRFYFKGDHITDFSEKANTFSLTKIDDILIPKAIQQLQEYKKAGGKVVIVSASFALYLKAWCSKNDFELIATELEVKDEKITGNFFGENCYGEEKLKRIRLSYDLSNYEVHAYGDTKGDLPMLSIAQKSFYRVFN